MTEPTPVQVGGCSAAVVIVGFAMLGGFWACRPWDPQDAMVLTVVCCAVVGLGGLGLLLSAALGLIGR